MVAEVEPDLRVVLISSRVSRATATRLTMVAIMENPASGWSGGVPSSRRLMPPPSCLVAGGDRRTGAVWVHVGSMLPVGARGLILCPRLLHRPLGSGT